MHVKLHINRAGGEVTKNDEFREAIVFRSLGAALGDRVRSQRDIVFVVRESHCICATPERVRVRTVVAHVPARSSFSTLTTALLSVPHAA